MGRASKDRNSQPLTREDRRAVPKIAAAFLLQVIKSSRGVRLSDHFPCLI